MYIFDLIGFLIKEIIMFTPIILVIPFLLQMDVLMLL